MPVIGSNTEITTDYLGPQIGGRIYLGSTLVQPAQDIIATGGTITTSGSYVIHTFTSGTGSFEILQGPSTFTAELLVVAGGGGGGQGNTVALCATSPGGGGGAGGVVYSGSFAVDSTNYTVIVGEGAPAASPAGPSVSGDNSSFGAITAIGGGGGGTGGFDAGRAAKNGGSGGGEHRALGAITGAGTGTAGQGNNGALATSPVVCDFSTEYTVAGGGGGAGGAASNGTGGIGIAYDISGTSVTYSAGGSSNGAAGSNPGDGGGSANAGANGIVIIKYNKIQ